MKTERPSLTVTVWQTKYENKMKLFLAKKGEILTSIERLLHNCFCYYNFFSTKKIQIVENEN